MPKQQINPWSNNQTVDIEKLFSDFGIARILCAEASLSDIGITTR
jgi:hypothetical protein